MFGISWAEFLVILVVAVIVIPAKYWPDVAAFLGRAVRTIRTVMWKISDATEQITQQIDLQRPIDDIIQSTTDEMLSAISTVRPKKKATKKSQGKK